MADRSHELLTALRRGSNLITPGASKQQTDKQREHFDKLAAHIERAQKFDFTGIQKTFGKELLCTAAEALWHDLLTVPFDPSIFNFDLPEQKTAACVLVSQLRKDLIPGGLRNDVNTICAYPLVTATTPISGNFNFRHAPSRSWMPGEWVISGIITVIQKVPEDEDTFQAGPIILPGFDVPFTREHAPEGQVMQASELVLQALACLIAKGIKLDFNAIACHEQNTKGQRKDPAIRA
jgi:hypothetical protein